jgi:hypothetical protein
MTFNPHKYTDALNDITTEYMQQDEKVEDVIQRIESSRVDIAPEYSDWVKVGFAISSEYGELGRNYFHRISKHHVGYDAQACDKQYSECLNGKRQGVTIATFFHFAKNAGVYAEEKHVEEIKKIPKNKLDKIESFLNAKFKFRYNVVRGQTEICKVGANTFEPLTDYIENSILRDLLRNNINCSQAKLRAILGSDFCVKYNPFEAYFSSLQPWDKKADYIEGLANTVDTTNQTFWLLAFKKWLVASVACLLDPKVVNHSVIVFSGNQGLGKTTWMVNLCPDVLQDYIFSGTINPNNKDSLIYLSQCFLINLDELENLNRSEIGALKELITKQVINVRKAYGKYNETIIRRASFMGSVNVSQFLNDTTGSRRFLAFEALTIDYKHQLNLEKIYAQAYSLYKSGFKYYFDKEDIEMITDNNLEYQITTVEEGFLLRYFEPVNEANAKYYLTATEVLERINSLENLQVNNASSISIGKYLKKHNFMKKKKNTIYKWAVKPINGMDVSKYQ